MTKFLFSRPAAVLTFAVAALALLTGMAMLDNNPVETSGGARPLIRDWNRPVLQDDRVKPHMKKIRRAVKTIEKNLSDQGMREEVLTAVRTLQMEALLSKNGVPKNARRMDDGEAKAAFLKGYRLMLVQFVKATLDLEAAILQDKIGHAKEILEQLEELEDEGHSKYKKRRR